MALKQSPLNKEVKIPSLCQMCDESSNIKWMCIECDLSFCAECELKFHKKSKTLAGHNKIDIEQCGKENIAKAIHKAGLKNMNCKLHSDLICVLFCQNCQQPVCTNCVLTNSHEEHKLFSISDVYDEKLYEMEDFHKRVQKDILFCSQVQSELKQILDGGMKRYSEQKDILLSKETDLITESQKNTKALLDEVDSEWKTLEGSLTQEINVMKTIKDQIEKERETFSNVSSPTEMLTRLYPSSENKHSPKKSIHQMILKQISYNPKYEITQNDIQQILKHFLQKEKGLAFQMKKSYPTKLKDVSKVLLLDNNQALIASEKDKIVQKINFDNKDIKVLKTLSETRAYDMAKVQNGDIIISVQESQLKLFSEKDTIEPFHSFSPLKTFGIHVNKDNEILVGISTGLPDREEEISKPGKIVVLNSEGSVKRTYEYDKKSHSKEFCLCTCPTRIVTNPDKSISFIDILTKNKHGTYDGRIVNIDQEGKLMWTYEEKYGFRPTEIAMMNTAGCLLVVSAGRAFHILSQNGSVITKSNNFNIKDITEISLAVDKEMKLYVGEKNHRNTYRPYVKIHILEFT
ncbi:tripartite motif-containing protein 75-like [Mytilus californianus]|uniref:tripartite motif-containing protein 75-like n=1 Tax=Mytilus californianus TaxID=6549 RepID=UPI002246BD2E|nr:tripartite motif-containing protein 75-like [Mytilus californianus]